MSGNRYRSPLARGPRSGNAPRRPNASTADQLDRQVAYGLRLEMQLRELRAELRRERARVAELETTAQWAEHHLEVARKTNRELRARLELLEQRLGVCCVVREAEH